MRKRIFEIIEVSKDGDTASAAYDTLMLVVIVVSLIPLAFKSEPFVFLVIDKVAAVIFCVDYLLRWLTADYKLEARSSLAFIRYPFTLMAIIDLISILPSVGLIGRGFKVLRVMRMLRALRVVRMFKAFRYSRNFQIIISVLRTSKKSLLAVGTLAVGYIVTAALIIFNVEPDTFDTFFDAVYWATISLTTVGYGDIYPVSTAGQIITMVSSFLGIAIVALPAGIITAGYMNAINEPDTAISPTPSDEVCSGGDKRG